MRHVDMVQADIIDAIEVGAGVATERRIDRGAPAASRVP
jgi:hypothetical protein